MKTIITLATIIFSVGMACAQTPKSYWVIETNANKKDYTILRVYDQQNALIHEETLTGKSLSVLAKKDRKLIDKKVKEFFQNGAIAKAESVHLFPSGKLQ